MTSVEDLLNDVLVDEDSESFDRGGAAGKTAGEEHELDLAAFVEDLGNTADELDKCAEALPSSPELAAEQLRVLDNPLSLTRRQVHEQHKRFFRPALPQSPKSESVPTGLGDIQKRANAGETGSYLLSRIRSRGH